MQLRIKIARFHAGFEKLKVVATRDYGCERFIFDAKENEQDF